jgi:LPS sulfotransferase NodH
MLFSSCQPPIYNPPPCWILTHWRSGSYYLASLLNTTDRSYDEWLTGGYRFNPEPWQRPWPKWQRFGESITKIQMLQTLPPYLKLHPVNYWSLFTKEDKEQIEHWLPDLRYILLRRKDLVATTVSFYIARHVDIWVAYTDEEVEDHAAVEIPIIREELIQDYREAVRWQWDDYLQDSPRLEIYYEDIIDNKEEVQKVFDFLEIEDEPAWGNASKRFRHPQTDQVRAVMEDIIAKSEHLDTTQPSEDGA